MRFLFVPDEVWITDTPEVFKQTAPNKRSNMPETYTPDGVKASVSGLLAHQILWPHRKLTVRVFTTLTMTNLIDMQLTTSYPMKSTVCKARYVN